MYFRRPTTTNILNVSDYFANLNNIDTNNDYVFDFTYSISQRDALAASALRVEISIYSSLVTPTGVLTPSLQNGQINSSKLIDNMRSQLIVAKTTKQQQDSFLLFRNRSDITSYIDNRTVSNKGSAASDDNFRKIKLKTRSAADLTAKNEEIPVLIFNSSAAESNDHDLQRLYDDMLRHGKDPSMIVDMTRYSITPHDNTQGLSPTVRTREDKYGSAQLALNAHTVPALTPSSSSKGASDTQIVDLVSEVDDTLTISAVLRLSAAKRRLSNGRDMTAVYVVFDLVNTVTGEIVQTVNKVLDLTRHVQLYYTPRTPPIVSVNIHTSQYVNMDVKPADLRTTSVAVYRKKITRSSTVLEDYTQVDTLSSQLKSGQVYKYRVPAPVDEIHIYRFVPVGKSAISGFDFTNVVIPPLRMRQKNAVAISLQPIAAGLQIDIREFPSSVVSIQILARNLSRFEKDFTNVGTPILIDNSDKTVSTVSYVNSNIIDGEYYEYAVRLYYRDGLTEIAGHQKIQYLKTQPGKVTTTLSSVNITSTNELNVSFDITTSVISTNIDVLKDLLQSSDTLQYFNGDVQKEREFLSSLIAHNIQRVDLKTGVREDFGVITSKTFNDLALRGKNSVSNLQPGRKYRYEISALIREPETLFESFQKTKIDPVTKKTYTYNPSKFIHPITLTQGTLVTTAGLKSLFGVDQMLYGSIGVSQTLIASFDDVTTQALDVSVARFDHDLNLITWRVQGDISSVDHFLIAKNMNGIQTMIGKTHSEFPHGSCQFFHDITVRDIGQFSYVITPVFNDYTIGTAVNSNSIVVEGT